jgi:hypothetical protein
MDIAFALRRAVCPRCPSLLLALDAHPWVVTEILRHPQIALTTETNTLAVSE